MPAEWEKQESIWITWPYNKKDWPDLFESIPKKVAEIVSIISKTQKVNLIIKLNEKENKIIRMLKLFSAKLRNIRFLKIQTDRIWIRDFGPIYLVNNRTKSKIFINFKFNGWSKYKNFKKDNKVNLAIHKKTQIRKIIKKNTKGNQKNRNGNQIIKKRKSDNKETSEKKIRKI